MIRCDKDLGPCRIFASGSTLEQWSQTATGSRRWHGNSAWNSLDTASIGRVVFTDGGLPVVLPVTFVLDGDAVVFRTRAGSRLAGITSGSVLAFEVDDAGARLAGGVERDRVRAGGGGARSGKPRASAPGLGAGGA